MFVKDFYVGKNRLRNYHIMINYIENVLMALDVKFGAWMDNLQD